MGRHRGGLKPGESISLLGPDGTGPTVPAEVWNEIAADPKGFAEKVVATGRQGKLDGTEVQPTFEVTRTVKTITSEKLGEDGREDVTRSRKAKWSGEDAEWHDAIGKAGDAFGEIPEDADEVRFVVKRVGT